MVRQTRLIATTCAALITLSACGQPTTVGQPGAQTAASPQAAATVTATPARAAQSSAGASNTAIVAQVYQQVSPAVVTVLSTVLRGQGPAGPAQQQGAGSGFIIDQQGHILTNDHVIQDTNRLEVTLNDGRTVAAQLVGRDPFFDLAVIRINPSGSQLSVATLGDSDQLQIGELAIAIGNPFGLEGTVTTGVISARRAAISEPQGTGVLVDAIQTDAAINPGNSGGPLLNSRGEVIGINTLARLGVGGGTAGINFAIPINAAKRIVPSLIQTGTYAHPFMGVGTVPITETIARELNLPVTQGLIVQSVEPGTGAAQAGLRPAGPPREIRSREVGVGGDIIVAVDGQEVDQPADLLSYLERTKAPGQSVQLTIVRDGQRQSVTVNVGQRPTTPGR